MRKAYVVVAYPEFPEVKPELVLFNLPDHIYDHQLLNEIRFARGELDSEDFSAPQDLMDMALRNAALRLGVTWEYPGSAGTVVFDTLDDPDPLGYEEEEDETP